MLPKELKNQKQPSNNSKWKSVPTVFFYIFHKKHLEFVKRWLDAYYCFNCDVISLI